MAAYIVTYDLHQQGQNYERLIERLKRYGTHWHVQQSVWIVVSSEPAVQIRDNLTNCLDSNDKLVVAKLDHEAAWHGYSSEITQWLKKFL